jgi:hypothetical protein
MRTLVLIALVAVAFVVGGVCSAEERAVLASDHAEPCDVDVVILDRSSPRAPIIVSFDRSADATVGTPWLVWHCGTPEPLPPPVEALTAAVRAALRLRAPPVG